MRDDPAPAPPSVLVRQLGRTAYEPTWRAMQAFTGARDGAAPDEIWITEHPPVYTLGLAGRLEHVHANHGIPVVRVDRGGQVTYHGPGQLVVYVLFDLARLRLGVRHMVRAIESAVVAWLAKRGIAACLDDRAPGVYVTRNGARAKIAALGLRVSKGCTYHGVAINVAMDLAPFGDIDPCGHAGLPVAQVADFARPPAIHVAGAEVAALLAAHITGTGQ
jgi:lipoyl(octanoyl) transferase